MTTTKNYEWKYSSIGGVVRVKIESGEDIAHLGELDRKLWTVLSCPVEGLEFDRKTLDLLDSDHDGRIRVDEIVAAAQWLCSALKDRDSILLGSDTLPLSRLDENSETGRRLLDSARRILANLKLDKEEISLAEAADTVAIFSGTKLNGDGLITALSCETEELKALLAKIIASVGSLSDRSGEAGIGEAQLEAFFAACADYKAWIDASLADKAAIFPFGDETAAALDACLALKDKIADYFMRCKLIAFDPAVTATLDLSADALGAIASKNLAACSAEIAEYPLARPSADALLRFDGINPAWQPAFALLRSLVLDKEYPDAEAISEAQWEAVLAKFAAYTAWTASKKGAQVEALGYDDVCAILNSDAKAALAELIAADKALEAESNAIDEVCKLLYLYRDFAAVLRNYVVLSDFYGRREGSRAIFEAGRLFIDQRCCELCIKVADMGKHADMAKLSGMFLIYCACTSRTQGKTMNIVAVMTDGSTKNLRPGLNGVFYDRSGADWDAVVTKVVDNPISIKQAFWSPYEKFANTLTERINKSASEKESKVLGDMSNKANNVNLTPADGKAPEAPKQAPFDIAKFAGIFAAIGMAVAYLTTALAKIVNPWYNVFIILAVMIVFISGPSMFLAWQKLRKRNLGPVLNANGWAVNSVVLVNIMFGSTLTSVAKYPKLRVSDPYRKKSMPCILKWLIAILVIAAIVAVLYFTGVINCPCING